MEVLSWEGEVLKCRLERSKEEFGLRMEKGREEFVYNRG